MNGPHADFALLAALAAGDDLEIAELTALKGHLESCTWCREYFIEMQTADAQLVIAQASKVPARGLPRGMRQRFLDRAIHDGVPLQPREGIGFVAIGLVAVCLVMLLFTAATLKVSPFRNPTAILDPGAKVHSASTLRTHGEGEDAIANLQSGLKKRPPNVRAARPNVQADKVGLAETALPGKGRQFRLMLPVQIRSREFSSFAAAAGLPEILPAFAYRTSTPGLTLDASSDTFRHIAPPLFVFGEAGADGIRSNFDPGPPHGRHFRLIAADLMEEGHPWLQIPGGSPR